LSEEFKKWQDNRLSSRFFKLKRWITNPVGAFVRLLEFVYFGQPIVSFFVGKAGNLESIIHLGKSINTSDSNKNLNYLNSARVDLRTNFIQLDTGHVLNSGMLPNEIYSGQYWNQLRDIRKSKVGGLLPGIFYPVATQEYFFHFLLEEFPEMVASHGAVRSNLVFSNSNYKVFEIFSHPYRTYFFREIAKINGNSYMNSEMDSVFTELDDWLRST